MVAGYGSFAKFLVAEQDGKSLSSFRHNKPMSVLVAMPHLTKSFEIKPRDFLRGGEVSIQVRHILKMIGFSDDVLRRASVCAYESEINVVMYGGPGTLLLIADEDMITIEVRDRGEGIEDVEMAMKEGFSTSTDEYREMGFGAGMGLPNIKKNADHFEIHSKKGEGTYLKICVRGEDSSDSSGEK